MIEQYHIYKQRRAALIEQTQGPVMLVAAFEDARIRFHQESSFYYYTGINEPGAVCLIAHDGTSTLLLPQYATNRAQWMPACLTVSEKTAHDYGFDAVAYLGQPCKGYVAHAYFEPATFENLFALLQKIVAQKSKLFTVQRNYVVDRICSFVPGMAELVADVMPFVARMRRTKDKDEIQHIYNAIDVTMIAQEAAARAIGHGKNESQVQAAIDYILAEATATPAFPSIVGSGVNATVLHYNDNSRYMNNGECVIVDVGAGLNHYCGDLTRTYPVSGMFTARQKEVYTAVLEVQQHLAAVAQPGMWLRNDENKEKSLYHIMHNSFKARKLDQYIAHGVGHFLGLDVHDVGDVKEPLQEGDVITIEPGIYIPEESFGIRIEDNYWIVQGGAVCLSESLPSDVAAIEAMVQQDL